MPTFQIDVCFPHPSLMTGREYALGHLLDKHGLIALAEAFGTHALSLGRRLPPLGRTPELGSLHEPEGVGGSFARPSTAKPLHRLA